MLRIYLYINYIISRIKSLIFKKVFSIKGGKNLRVGKFVSLANSNICCGDNVYIGAFSEIKGQIEIENNVSIRRNVLINSFDGLIRIGEGTTINPYVGIYGHGKVDIGRYVSIATQTTIVASNHNYKRVDVI